MKKLEEWRKKIDEMTTIRRMVRRSLINAKREQRSMKNYLENVNTARWVITEVSKLTQSSFKDSLEPLVTAGIESVYKGKGYQFLVDFQTKGNRPEAHLMIQEGDNEPYYPQDEQAGGVVDITGMCSRFGLRQVENPPTRKLMFFDEPFRNTGALTGLAGLMLKTISKELGIQIIMITNDEDHLVGISDREWRVGRVGGKSKVLSSSVPTKEGKLRRPR